MNDLNSFGQVKKSGISLKTLVAILVVVSAVALATGKTGLFRGDIGGILGQKTTLTQDLCANNGGSWASGDDSSSPQCTYSNQVVSYLEDIQKIQLKTTCDSFASAGDFVGAGVSWTDGGCTFAGQTYGDNTLLKKAGDEYSTFKRTCTNAGGVFAFNQCSVSLSSQPITTLKDLNAKIFEKDCKTASGTYASNDFLGTCDVPGVGAVSSSTELKTKKLQVFCAQAKTLSDAWQNGKAVWSDPATCSFVGKDFTNYADLDAVVASSKSNQDACVTGGGTFMDNQCNLDTTKLLQNLCQKQWSTQVTAFNFGARWNVNNTTCSIAWIFSPPKIFQISETPSLNEALKKGKAALEDFQNMCKSVGGTLNTYNCIYNNKNFYIYSASPLSLKDEIDATIRAAADVKGKAENAAKVQDLQNQVNAKDQELKDRLSAPQQQNQPAPTPTVAPQSTDSIEALTRQISDLKDKISQIQSQQSKTPAPPVVAPIVCRDSSLVYDPALKGCVAPTIAPTITPAAPVKSPVPTKTGTSTSTIKQLRKSAPAPKKMQLSKEQIQQLLKALLEQLQTSDQ